MPAYCFRPATAAVSSAGGFKYASKVHQVPATGSTPRTLKSACPSKTRVIGGGHYNTGLYQQADVGHSFPYDSADKRKVPDNGWAVQLMSSSQLDVFTYAICAKLKPTYRQISLDVGPSGTVTGNVYCGIDGDIGLPIISGGTSGHEYARARTSYPVDDAGGYDSWAFTADNGSSAPRPVKAFAICADLDVSYHSARGHPSRRATGLGGCRLPVEQARRRRRRFERRRIRAADDARRLAARGLLRLQRRWLAHDPRRALQQRQRQLHGTGGLRRAAELN